jgi:hypothetical protein
MNQIEHNMQVACVRWFKYEYPKVVIMSIPNGGARNARVGAKLKAEGTLAGAPDLFIMSAKKGFHGLFVEMKTEIGVQQASQKEFEEKSREENYKYCVCRSFEQFTQIVEEYLRE